MKDAYYFSHDCGARNDPKMLQLRMEMGWCGYGLFFAFIEILREQQDHKYPSNAKATLELSLSISKELLEDFFKTATSVGLLVDDGDFIFSESLNKRMILREESRQKRVDAGRKGGIAKAKSKQSLARKGKERKGKEIERKSIYGEHGNVKLTKNEYEKLLDKFNSSTTDKINNLSEYMARVGKSYKSHYLTILCWSKKDNNPKETDPFEGAI